ncbi:hypothetical protein FDP41_006253 [Naegleria fowleri]|uniref:Uncharacterized protein n=1 Tax=Naegleria fowleri TaxID=5763 RepID=A0A6A5BPC2_NAEFO|nr:uncharacterized protein FDP41_006253 [Naegleria fowleri]KAF0974779.1 hypothetical protein FDP41_006253 [Naegleria fowleri]CAG4708540.1 unnamed protein product [Naegleria fowleri]
MSNQSGNVLYLVFGALASLFSTFKVIQTRRKLQQSRQTPVSLTEAIVHTAFDTIDVFSKEYQKISNVVEQRMLQLQAPSLNGNRVFAIQDENHSSLRKALPPPSSSARALQSSPNVSIVKSSSSLNDNNNYGQLLQQKSQPSPTNTKQSFPNYEFSPSTHFVSTLSTHDPMLASIPDHHQIRK